MNIDSVKSAIYRDVPGFYRRFLPDIRSKGKSLVAKCPFHQDDNPSLTINSEDGRFRCFGCEAEGDALTFFGKLNGLDPKKDFRKILEEIGGLLGVLDEGPRGQWHKVAAFDYRNLDGSPAYWKERQESGQTKNGKPEKRFHFFHSAGGQKQAGRNGKPLPYRLPELAQADTVFFCEGEAKADVLTGWGLAGTSLDSGTGSKWEESYQDHFRGKAAVFILPDNDDPGRAYADRIGTQLRPLVGSVKLLTLPDLPPKSDIVDWVRAGGNKEKFLELVDRAPEWEPSGGRIETPETSKKQAPEWPAPLQEQAFHGIAGEFVELIGAHTEADPAALLVQFLTGFGNLVGRTSYFMAEADRHYPNIFTVMVGETSKGRKGSSFGQVKRPLISMDEAWAERIKGGLASGEGLIWSVRDPIKKREPIRENGRLIGYQDIEADPGEGDKRLFVVEPEFASVLRVSARDGNTLSAIVRQAWDTGDLRTLTTGRSGPVVQSTDSHISIIGHVTKDELLRYLDRTEAGNGFGNRFLWCCVRRSKCLPEGGKAHEINLNSLIIRLQEDVTLAYRGEVRRDDEAREIWARVYPALSDGKPGMFGAVTSRAEAQVMRLALIYALLDQSALIKKEHLFAALAVWDYCEASARYIFGDAVGDPVADSLVDALRNAGAMTRTEISNFFGRNVSSGRIQKALSALEGQGIATRVRMGTEGRSVERWSLA